MVEQVMNENEFELDGKVYVAESYDIGETFNLCGNCSFRCRSELCEIAPSCGWQDRKDKQNVIFTEKQS